MIKNSAKDTKKKILSLTSKYSKSILKTKTFVAGVDPIPVSGKVLGAMELKNMVEASLDGWLTTGRFNSLF